MIYVLSTSASSVTFYFLRREDRWLPPISTAFAAVLILLVHARRGGGGRV